VSDANRLIKAEGECELLPGDKSRVISTHPVKAKK